MDKRIEKVLFFIEQNLAVPYSLEELANVACMSPNHFHQLFRQQMQESPRDYLDRTRLEHVAHMLMLRQDMSMTHAALEYGYSSPAAFSRAFKARYNETPLEFRKARQARHKEEFDELRRKVNPNQQQRLKVLHSPPKRLTAQRLVLQEDAINQAYRELISHNPNKVSHGITIYTENPFHHQGDEVRVHVALDDVAHQENNHKQLEIIGGYYFKTQVTGNLDSMLDTLFTVFYRDIEPSNYKVVTTVFYERVPLTLRPEDFDYYSTTREVFGCIGKR